MRRSTSEGVVPVRAPSPSSHNTSSVVRFCEGEARSADSTRRSMASLQPPRPTAHRATSNPQTELHSCYYNPAIPSESLRKELVEQTRPGSSRPVRSGGVHHVPTPGSPVIAKRPSPTRSTPVRSSSDPDLAKAFMHPKTRRESLPLKPCIKKKAKSTTPTPPGEFLRDDVIGECRPLRRVKTVDFEGSGSKPSQSLPQVLAASEEPTLKQTIEPPPSYASKSKKNGNRFPSCPNTIFTIKSSAADPAITRADVHVIAIAPSWNAHDVTNEEGMDPATPTMQIIETRNRSYEVIWNDVPSEHSTRLSDRRISSASHALEAVNPAAKRGLDRVNTKLADWSGSWNHPSDSFKPTIVVFPDDDSGAPHYDCAVDDEEDGSLWAPPNSRLTSASASCLPSRPVSAPITRKASCEEILLQTALGESPSPNTQDWEPPSTTPLVVPDTKQLVAVRQLPNMDDTDWKFREHRDSITIAHARLVNSGGVSPELFAHRDSVSMARKRMHARNHAMSAMRTTPRPKGTSLDALDLIANDNDSVVPLATIKEHATEAPKNKTSASMLRSASQSTNQRHIRIVE
jgi:hypothetical protein